jgi:hypothetical protein
MKPKIFIHQFFNRQNKTQNLKYLFIILSRSKKKYKAWKSKDVNKNWLNFKTKMTAIMDETWRERWKSRKMSTIIDWRPRERVKSNQGGREGAEKCTDSEAVRWTVREFFNAGRLIHLKPLIKVKFRCFFLGISSIYWVINQDLCTPE